MKASIRKLMRSIFISGRLFSSLCFLSSFLCVEIVDLKFRLQQSKLSFPFSWNMVNCSNINFGKWSSKVFWDQHLKKSPIPLSRDLSRRNNLKSGSTIHSLNCSCQSMNLLSCIIMISDFSLRMSSKYTKTAFLTTLSCCWLSSA